MKKLLSIFTILNLAISGSLLFAAVEPVVEPTVTPIDSVTDQGSADALVANEGVSSALAVADFDTGDKPNNIGGDFGSWDKDPNDETQSCQMSFESDDAMGDKAGYSLRLDYDVDSPNPAYNGFWMKLNQLDASQYSTLNFYIKGDAAKGYTKRVKIELKDGTGASPYIASGITDEWQKISIPFEKFRRIKDWTKLTEFVVVFDDINSNPKSGAIYIDHVSFSAE